MQTTGIKFDHQTYCISPISIEHLMLLKHKPILYYYYYTAFWLLYFLTLCLSLTGNQGEEIGKAARCIFCNQQCEEQAHFMSVVGQVGGRALFFHCLSNYFWNFLCTSKCNTFNGFQGKLSESIHHYLHIEMIMMITIPPSSFQAYHHPESNSLCNIHTIY